MNRRGTGVIFCLIAALLYIAHYITTAIYLSNMSSWDAHMFKEGLKYTGSSLDILSVIFLVAGLVYLFWAEGNDLWGANENNKEKEQIENGDN